MPLKFIILLFIKHCDQTYSTFNQQLFLFLKSLEIYCWFLFIVSYLLWVHILLILHQRPPLGLISHKEASFADGMRRGTTSDHCQSWSNIQTSSFPIFHGPSVRSQTQSWSILSRWKTQFLLMRFCFFVCLSLAVFPTSWDSSDVL